MESWTIQKLLNWITQYFTDKNIDSPRLSAEILLSSVLALERIELYTQFDQVPDKQQLHRLHALVKRAGQSEPVAYLTGKTEFYSLELNITPDCLIPRPETELLVERAIEFLRARTAAIPATENTLQQGHITENTLQEGHISDTAPPGTARPRTARSDTTRAGAARPGTQYVCDLCTGCGCIAVAIARNFPDADIIATDISSAALDIAAENIEKHHLKDRIALLCGDLFEPLIRQLDTTAFDLILCNPPYVSTSEFEALDKNVKDYEPKLALLAGTDGLDIYRKIIEKADLFLKQDAALMLEIGYAQGPAVRKLLEQTGAFAEIKIEKDLHNNDRIVTAARIPS